MQYKAGLRKHKISKQEMYVRKYLPSFVGHVINNTFG